MYKYAHEFFFAVRFSRTSKSWSKCTWNSTNKWKWWSRLARWSETWVTCCCLVSAENMRRHSRWPPPLSSAIKRKSRICWKLAKSEIQNSSNSSRRLPGIHFVGDRRWRISSFLPCNASANIRSCWKIWSNTLQVSYVCLGVLSPSCLLYFVFKFIIIYFYHIWN